MRQRSRFVLSIGLAAALLACGMTAGAQMVTGKDMPGFADTFGLKAGTNSPAFTAVLARSSVPGNVLWPGEQPRFTLQISNNTDNPIRRHGRIEIVAYGTRGQPGDIWVPRVFKIGAAASVPLDLDIAAKGFSDFEIAPKLPARFGGYALVADLGPFGRQFVGTCVRTFRPAPERIQYPRFCLDTINLDVLKRMGVQAVRYGVGYKPTTDRDYDRFVADEAKRLKAFQDANIAVLFMIGGGDFFSANQPLGRPRPWLDDSGTMLDTKFDLAWLPSYDDDFQKYVHQFAATFGWPKGPINAFSLWNEPWEGISISGWGADMPRYREIYMKMAQGVEEARTHDGVDLLVGGCDSTSNALDKLFGDGSDKFLKWFDFCSIHYQGLDPGATIKMWTDRKGPRGRVRIWDTESWVANTDDRVAAVIAANRAAGYDRAMGVYRGNIAEEEERQIRLPDGKSERRTVLNTYSVAASVGAAQHFIGERDFKRLLFLNGLPWVMMFDGLPSKGAAAKQPAARKNNPEDGTLVVVGDLGEEFGAENLPFRTARGFNEMAHKAALKRQLDALPADASAAKRSELQTAQAKFETLDGAAMTLSSAGGRFNLFDFYGNAVPATNGRIVVPLDGRGFFLRGDGRSGSFAKLVDAVRTARIEGIEPVAVVAHDMTAAIETRPAMSLTFTNILNRPVTGTLRVSLGHLTTAAPGRLSFKPNETKTISVKVTGGASVPGNTYPLALRFDAGRDGTATHEEEMHVNTIARRTIIVDGNLDDWKDVPPQPVKSPDTATPSLTEAAWFPFKQFDTSLSKGFATGYLAYDESYFYFAAKIADSTPDPGMVRYETHDEDESFYPEKSYVKRIEHPGIAPVLAGDTATPKELTWPEGVRRYSYRKDPELPSGNFPNHDNVQIAFNVLPQSAKPWRPTAPGTMFGFVAYRDTDYEFALNPVAEKYGGGTEIWRLLTPGMPRKHHYPRQGKSPFDGPVKDGKLVIKRDGNTRIVECAIPWTEIPDVKRRLDAGQTVKFSYRVNDNANPGCMELSRLRSVARRNGSFHVDWTEHWANELEFGFEK